jgi:hypothetical protein
MIAICAILLNVTYAMRECARNARGVIEIQCM